MSDVTGDMTAAVTSAFEAASTPDAATTTTTEPQSAPTSAAPVEGVSAAEPTETTQTTEPGPIPYPRFKEVNDGYQATKKELDALAWAKGIKAEDATGIAEFYRRMQADPVNTILAEVDALMQHEHHAQAMKSHAARILGKRIGGQPQATEPAAAEEPQPDVQLSDGSWTYSAKGLQERDAWLQRRWESKIDERIAPLKESSALIERREAERIADQLKSDARTQGLTEVMEMRKQPHFTEHEKDIKAAMLADESLSLQQAYTKVFIDKVIPKLAKGQAAVLQQKTGANSANPSRPSGATPAPAQDFHEEVSRLLS